ncbi:MAG: ABC transporter substrate-binding protein [Acidimicrobiales bacterium]
MSSVSRQRGRTPAVAMLGFLAGLLLAALLIPSHSGTGLVASGGQSAGGDAGTSSGISSGTSSGKQAGTPGVRRVPGRPVSSAGDASGGSPGSSGSGVGAPSSQPGDQAAAPGSTTPTATATGGATAVGVTANSISIGILGGDSSGIAPACPRCGQGGLATDQATVSGLLALWHKQGRLPVNGRDLKPFFQSSNDLDATGASQQSACEKLAADKVFVSVTGTGAEGADACLTKQHHILLVDAGGGIPVADVQSASPMMWEVGASLENALFNFALWADQQNLLKGQVLGIYAPADSSTYGNIQEIMAASFIAELKRLGYHIAVNYAWGGEGQTDDSVAVAKMKAAGVTVVFVVTGFTEPAGFQSQANQAGYHPKYPAPGYGSSSFTDATGDITWNATAENGNNLFATSWWGPWSVRKPATAAGNPVVQECLDAYSQTSHTTLDVYTDDAKILYILSECSDLDVILQALTAAGPHLTQATFIQSIEAIHAMQTPLYSSVTFGPRKLFGSDDWQLAQFNKNRWQPSNDYIDRSGSPQPWFAQY